MKFGVSGYSVSDMPSVCGLQGSKGVAAISIVALFSVTLNLCIGWVLHSPLLGWIWSGHFMCGRCSLSWVAYPIDSYPLASLAGILNLGLALAIASGVITASVRPKAGQAPVFEGKPTFRTTPTPKMYTASYESNL